MEVINLPEFIYNGCKEYNIERIILNWDCIFNTVELDVKFYPVINDNLDDLSNQIVQWAIEAYNNLKINNESGIDMCYYLDTLECHISKWTYERVLVSEKIPFKKYEISYE